MLNLFGDTFFHPFFPSSEKTGKRHDSAILSRAGVWLWGQADLWLVLQLLGRMTLCLTPWLETEPRQARPLLADKERILSPPLSSQPRGWETNERPGEDRVAGIGRLTEPERVREEDTERGMYRVCPLVPGDLQKACLIGIFHLKMVWPSRVKVAKCFLGDLEFHLEKKPLSSPWRCKRQDFPPKTQMRSNKVPSNLLTCIIKKETATCKRGDSFHVTTPALSRRLLLRKP